MKKVISYILLAITVFMLSVVVLSRSDQEFIPPVPPSQEAVKEDVPTVTAEPSAEPTPTPTPTPTPEPQPEYFTVSVIGDCTLASCNGASNYEKYMGEDYAYPFSNTVQYFEADDFTIANLECTFSDSSLYSSRLFHFQGKSAYANILTEGGVDFVTTANNHADDFGTTGMQDTYASLEAAGMAYGKEDEAQIYTTESGLKIGVYCLFDYFCTGASSTAKIEAGIQSLKEQGAEYIICALHWGNEGHYDVVTAQDKCGHAAIDAGADLVYGCHPHVMQKTEEYNGGIILYSMGNWSFGGNTNPRDRDTAIVQVTVKRDVDGTVSNDKMTIIPCCLSSTEGLNDYRPVPYAEDDEGYARALSKLDGSWTGPNLTINY